MDMQQNVPAPAAGQWASVAAPGQGYAGPGYAGQAASASGYAGQVATAPGYTGPGYAGPAAYGQMGAPATGGFPAAPAVVNASLGARVGAGALDGFLWWARLFIVSVGVLKLATRVALPGSALHTMLVLVLTPLAVLAIGLLPVFTEGSGGRTSGQRTTKIRVVDAETGAPLGFGRALLRWVMMGLLGWLTLFSVQFDSTGRGQGWHDKAARARVIVDQALAARR